MPNGKLVRKLHVRMLSAGDTSGDKFLPTTVRLNLGCVRISDIALDAIQIRGGNSPAHELNQTVNLDMINIRLTGDNLVFKSLSNSMSGDVVDTAVFAHVLTCLPVDNIGAVYDRVTFDTDKPTCAVTPPTNLQQIKVEISKVNGTDEIAIGSRNASIDMVFSLYSEDSVSS